MIIGVEMGVEGFRGVYIKSHQGINVGGFRGGLFPPFGDSSGGYFLRWNARRATDIEVGGPPFGRMHRLYDM